MIYNIKGYNISTIPEQKKHYFINYNGTSKFFTIYLKHNVVVKDLKCDFFCL